MNDTLFYSILVLICFGLLALRANLRMRSINKHKNKYNRNTIDKTKID